MTAHEAREKVRELLLELRRTRFVPDEKRDKDRPGQLGFDYGYQQATYEVESKLYLYLKDEA